MCNLGFVESAFAQKKVQIYLLLCVINPKFVGDYDSKTNIRTNLFIVNQTNSNL